MYTAIPVPTIKHESEDKEKEAKLFKNTCSLFFKAPLKTSNEDELLTYILLWLGLEAFWANFDSTYREQVPQLTYRFNLRNLTQGEDEKIIIFIK